jgi:pyruvate kinase
VGIKRRTKIVATVGPATYGPGPLRELVAAGADCLRFNFSHGDHPWHLDGMRAARAAARSCGRQVAVMADLCGPKIRTGPAPEGGVRLKRGSRLELVSGSAASNPERIAVSYSRLAREVRPGQRVLLSDGRIELVVERVRSGRVVARVKVGGVLGARKGVNLPGARLSGGALTPKDRRDLAAAAEAAPDYVALSFVRSPRDLGLCRRAMKKVGLGEAGLIAKIEKPEALECIDDLLERCDGIMVARGDLGVEMHPEEVPTAQRELVEKAARRDRLCIVATEMFESMVSSARPTRAEVSDVAGAVREGADAVMLSAETSVGRYPLEAVRAMSRVLAATERSLISTRTLALPASLEVRGGITDILSVGATLIGREAGSAVFVAATESGRTALYLSKSRPPSPILGMSPSETALRRMALYWGVIPVPSRSYKRHHRLIRAAERAAVRLVGARRGQCVVVLSGTPLGISGNTNTLQLRRVGE